MTFSASSQNNLYGFPQPFTKVFPPPIVSSRSPLTSDFQFPLGQQWINSVSNQAFVLVSVTANVADWDVITTVTGTLDTLTGDVGGPVSPTTGNINILGTANQIQTAGSAGTLRIAFPFSMILPGPLSVPDFLAVQLGITCTTNDVVLGNGNLNFQTAGNKIVSTNVATTNLAGANSFGTVTLIGGVANILTTAVTASSIIMTSRIDNGTSTILGLLSIGGVVPGSSFFINSVTAANASILQVNDASKIAWFIIN